MSDPKPPPNWPRAYVLVGLLFVVQVVLLWLFKLRFVP